MSGHPQGRLPGAGAVQPLQPSDPARVGPHAVEGRLGEGGMGVVYLARSPDGDLVAVKVVRPQLAGDPGFRARFRSEAAAARRVVGFCTARVLGGDTEAPAPYLVTEYVPGPSLDAAVRGSGPLRPGDVEGFAAGVAMALTAIHRAGIVHRDLTPRNVILSPSGPRVIDFGIARPSDAVDGHTRVGEVVGSPGWMAPEQLRQHPLTPAVDVFAWAGLVVFAAAGRPPFGEGPPAVVAARVLSGSLDLVPGRPGAFPEVMRALSPRLMTLVQAAFDPDPSRRPTAETVLSTLLDAVPPPGTQVAGPQAVAGPGADPGAVTQIAPGVGRTRVGAPAPWQQQAPPGQWQQPPSAPGSPAGVPSAAGVPPPRRRRRVRTWILAIVGLLLLGSVLDSVTKQRAAEGSPGAAAAGGTTAPRTPPPRSSTTARPPRPSATPAPRLPAARDGDIAFSVRRLRCGVRRIGSGLLTHDAPQGQEMCLVDLRMRNVGKSGHLIPDQLLYDAQGRQFTPNPWLVINLGQRGVLWTVLQPGTSAEGTLVYEVPRGMRPAEMGFRANVLSRGTRRPVADS